ncbi:MAG: hypothetical protein R6V19_17350 [Armatimonadota bacterium]
MSGKRYTEEQIVRILGEIEGGRTVAATCAVQANKSIVSATVNREITTPLGDLRIFGPLPHA